MKRPASSTAAGRGKKSRGADSIKSVVAAVAHTDVLPAGQRTYLASILPAALDAYKADRTAFQKELIGKAEKVLNTIKAGKEEAAAKALKTSQELTAPSERKTREATKERAHKDLDNAIKTMVSAKEAAASALKAVQEAKHATKTFTKDLASYQSGMKTLTLKKAALESALTTDFELLKVEGCTTPDGKKALKSVLMLGSEHGFDKSLCQSFPQACQKAEVARTEFENKVFGDIKASFDQSIGSFSQKLAESAPVEALKKDATARAEAALAEATDGLSAAEAHFSKSSDSVVSIKPAVQATTKFLKHIWRDMKASCNLADELAADLKEFNELIAALQKLKEKKPEPEVVAEPVAVVDPYAQPAA